MLSEEITLDRLSVEDLRDEFYDALNKIVKKANDAIESAESEVNEARDKLFEAEEKIEELENDELEKLRAVKKQIIDFDAVERMVNFAPGDPGKLYPLHDRVERVLKRADVDRKAAENLAKKLASERDVALAELQNLKNAIIPELERLEGHENRLRVIVDEFAGKVKGERLSALLREAKEALN